MLPEPYNGFSAEGDNRLKAGQRPLGEVGRAPLRVGSSSPSPRRPRRLFTSLWPDLLKEKNKQLAQTVLWKQADKTRQQDTYNMLQKVLGGNACPEDSSLNKCDSRRFELSAEHPIIYRHEKDKLFPIVEQAFTVTKTPWAMHFGLAVYENISFPSSQATWERRGLYLTIGS